MFEGFSQVWTPVGLASRVRRKPVRIVVAGVPVVLFRAAGGRIGALVDRCPHRGAALSLGKVGADGCLECAFHGWRFDADGANRFVPLNPEAKLDQLGAMALPARQLGELVWIYTRPGETAPPEPALPDALSSPEFRRVYVERLWRCHWTRAMENMLDSPHLPFVHRRTIGRGLRRRMTPASSLEVAWEETPWGGRARAALDGDSAGGGAGLEFHRPNIMTLLIPIPGRRLLIHALVIPERAGHTRLLVVGSRDFNRSPLFDAAFAWTNAVIADEDKAVVESSGPDEVPPAADERSVRTDRATLQFRKYYYDRLRESAA